MLTQSNLRKTKELVVIIDDDKEVSGIVSDILSDEGYRTACFNNGKYALEFIYENSPSVIFLDLWLDNDESAGFEILKSVKKLDRHIPIIMISGHGNIDIAIKALKLGAYDFIEKPFNLDKLLTTTAHAIEIVNLRKENESLKTQSDFNTYLIGNSVEITKTRSLIKKSAASNSRILITAGHGSGVSLIAQYIYENSPRNYKGFASVDCSLSDQDELAVELFGNSEKAGILEKLDEGTIFLQYIDKLSNDLQIRLLKFLQSGSFQPIGSQTIRKPDVRVISSCVGENLKELVANKSFKEDLFFRISVVPIQIPKLSSRREDIPTIVEYMIEHSEELFKMKIAGIEDEAMILLSSYDWPGNVRQLQNIVEVACIMTGNNGTITSKTLPRDLLTNTEKDETCDLSNLITKSLKEAREVFEKSYISMQIDRFSGNISQVANFIGMERSALHRKLKSLDISNSKYRSADE